MTNPTGPPFEDELSRRERARFFRVAAAVLASWRRIVATGVGAMAVAILIGLLLPRTYTARTLLYPSQGERSGPALPAQLQGSPLAAALGAGSGSDESRLIGMILESRSLADSIRARFGAVTKDIAVSEPPEGGILVEVTLHDPEEAAAVAAAYAPLINRFVADIGRQVRERKTRVVEQQLVPAREALLAIEERLVRFQESEGGPGIQAQATGTLETVLQLRRGIAEEEIRIEQLRRTSTPDNPQLRSAEADLAARRRQLRTLTSGSTAGDLLPSLREAPELQARAARLLRELREAEEIYVSLSASLASLQVRSNDDLPAVSVLDPAVAPLEPDSRKLWLIGALALVLGLLGGLASVVGRYWAGGLRREPELRPFFDSWDGVKGSFTPRLPRGRRARMPVGGPDT